MVVIRFDSNRKVWKRIPQPACSRLMDKGWTGSKLSRLESLQECVCFPCCDKFVVTKHASIGIHGHRSFAVMHQMDSRWV